MIVYINSIMSINDATGMDTVERGDAAVNAFAESVEACDGLKYIEKLQYYVDDGVATQGNKLIIFEYCGLQSSSYS